MYTVDKRTSVTDVTKDRINPPRARRRCRAPIGPILAALC